MAFPTECLPVVAHLAGIKEYEQIVATCKDARETTMGVRTELLAAFRRGRIAEIQAPLEFAEQRAARALAEAEAKAAPGQVKSSVQFARMELADPAGEPRKALHALTAMSRARALCRDPAARPALESAVKD